MSESELLQDAEILAKAQKDYPVGTFYYDRITGINRVAVSPRWFSKDHIIIDGGINTSPIFMKSHILNEGDWARIIEPEELTPTQRVLWEL